MSVGKVETATLGVTTVDQIDAATAKVTPDVEANSSIAMDIASNLPFQARVQYFLFGASLSVLTEDPATASHAERVAFAKAVFNGTASILHAAIATLTDQKVAALGFGVDDGTLQAAVAAVYNALAGVST